MSTYSVWDKLMLLLVPQSVKEQFAKQQEEIDLLKIWKDKVESVWPEIMENSNGTN